MLTRRSLLKSLLTAAAIVPVAGALLPSEAEAQRGAPSGPGRRPPPPRSERRPPPRRGYTWVPGHWSWSARQGWFWSGGYWERNRAGFRLEGGRWVLRRGEWVWEPYRWVRHW